MYNNNNVFLYHSAPKSLNRNLYGLKEIFPNNKRHKTFTINIKNFMENIT